MADPAPDASSPAVRARMRAQRTSGTAPELAVRRAMHGLGLRYRLGRRVEGCWPDRDVASRTIGQPLSFYEYVLGASP